MIVNINKSQVGKLILRLSILLVVMFIALGLAAQSYASLVIGKGRIITLDYECGWKLTPPNLNTKRVSPNVVAWRIITDRSGIRGPANWSSHAKKRFLLLGDSTAFGERVDIQEFIYAKQYLSQLKEGDSLVLLTCMNDFYDILRKGFCGRVKPRFSFEEEKLSFHKPEISFFDFLRNGSYIYASIAASLEKQKNGYSFADFKKVVLLYSKIVEQQMPTLIEKKVIVIVGLVGLEHLNQQEKAAVDDMYKDLAARSKIHYVSLDNEPLSNPANYFADGHWSKEGHALAALTLDRYIKEILAQGR